MASGVVNTAHQLGSTPGVAILTSAAAGATTLAEQIVHAYTGGAVMLAISLAAAIFLIAPSKLKHRPTPGRRTPATTTSGGK